MCGVGLPGFFPVRAGGPLRLPTDAVPFQHAVVATYVKYVCMCSSIECTCTYLAAGVDTCSCSPPGMTLHLSRSNWEKEQRASFISIEKS